MSAGVASGSVEGGIQGAVAGKNAVENNTIAFPARYFAPAVSVRPGDKVRKDADNKIASGLDDAIKDVGGALDKATQCSFGRVCSSVEDEKQNQPNLGKDLNDDEKTELGGSGSGTPGGWGPEDEEHGRDKNLSTSDQRSIKSLEEQIRLHEDKLEAYKKNPDSFDNKGYLQNAPNEQVKQRIIDGRIRHLEQKIKTFHKNIDEIKNSKG
ncbi:VENN motif pre-toxin domain-containing protein [Duffyella gerundensis]|uniref:VENN motif pre-toxin domain-containing protein n=1 Tax=Duffyella gerundensis TaxID=1619313 RepID=UPI00223AC08E|nr:VENN motif pre-toxin domain-containing protein [Duffyella gerundensis]